MKGDSLLYAKGYGYSRIEDSTKCTIDNIFRIASVSKLITATAIMKLCEENKLSTQSKVFGEDGIFNEPKFLDIKDKNIKEITVEHLLNHTSGLARPHGDVAFNQELAARFLDKELPLSVDDFVLYATKIRQRAKAGTWYHYSNLGYIILSKIIEKVSGMSYENYVRDSVLIPNGCNNMYLAQNFTENFRENEVFYYEVKEATPVPACDGSNRKFLKSRGGNNIRVLSGAGGWLASPIELLKFATTINNNTKINKFLSQESINYMTEDQNKPIGWASVTQKEWIRTGSMPGTSSIIKSERNGYTWVFISNSSSWNGPSLPKQINRDISRAISNVKEWPNTNFSFTM
jgi:Beta-lactamase class C and other penicillin binding proteins